MTMGQDRKKNLQYRLFLSWHRDSKKRLTMEFLPEDVMCDIIIRKNFF